MKIMYTLQSSKISKKIKQSKHMKNMEVLLVEDNQSITKMLSKFLELEGIKCSTSNSGQNGLEMIQNHEWDNVLLDLTMPEFSGYDVLQALRQDGKIKSKNIIILTATEITKDEIKDWKNEGVKEVIRKPISDLDYLIKILNQ